MASELRVQVAAARRLSLPRGMAFAIGLALAMRVALSLIGAWLLSFETPAESPLVKQQLLGQVPLHDPWLAPWQRFDALWYTRIAAYGYRGDDVSTVYFPLYPLLIRAASTLLGGNIMLAGLVVSWLCFTALLVLLYRLVAQDHGESKARTTLLLLCAFPTASYCWACTPNPCTSRWWWPVSSPPRNGGTGRPPCWGCWPASRACRAWSWPRRWPIWRSRSGGAATDPPGRGWPRRHPYSRWAPFSGMRIW